MQHLTGFAGGACIFAAPPEGLTPPDCLKPPEALAPPEARVLAGAGPCSHSAGAGGAAGAALGFATVRGLRADTAGFTGADLAVAEAAGAACKSMEPGE